MTSITGRKTIRERMEDAEIVAEPSGCWRWDGEARRGRAKVHHDNGTMNASKGIWEAYYGRVPHPDLEVCHACHNPYCVNINHLYLANHQRNMADSGPNAPVLPFAADRTPPPSRRAMPANEVQRARYLRDSRMLHLREIALIFDVTEKTLREALRAEEQ